MQRSLVVTCPCCGEELDIDIASAKVIRHGKRAAPDAKPDLGRFDAALSAVKSRPGQALDAFERAKSALQGRESKLDAAFKDAVKKVKETDDGSKPLSPFDLE